MAFLQKSILAILIPGHTHVLERNGDEAYVYFGSDGTAHMLLEDGKTRTGQWRILNDGYQTDWNTGVTGDWRLDHEPGAVTYASRDGAIRFKMIGVLFGNAKGLPRM